MPQIVYDARNNDVLQTLTERHFDSKAWFDLKVAAEHLSLTRGFERLLSLDNLSLELYDHQRQAILRVLRHMRGRAVLADEVGLGKTIEAGVILREYYVRGLVRRALVLVPPTLVDQWLDELTKKLSLPFRMATGPGHWHRYERIVASLDTAKRPEHASMITQVHWDIVIIDEAHRLKNRESVNWQFVNNIRKNYLLLLTATPVQNDLDELFHLITLLKPGQLHTHAQFRREYTRDRHSPKNLLNLKQRLDDVMVRTTRRETLLRFPKREIRSMSVPMGSLERDFYMKLVATLRTCYENTPKSDRNLLPLILLLRQATSHPIAAARTMGAMYRRNTLTAIDPKELEHMTRLAQKITPTKFSVIGKALKESDMHAILFTSFKETARQLVEKIEVPDGRAVVPFHGGLDADAKRDAIQRFRDTRGVLVSTETGSEGMNLQFCRTVINYDLPWNPMRLEQRIGRVHRLGQTEDVRIYNLVTEGTIEAYILYLLEKKINMFNMVVGELEAILSNISGDFEMRIAEVILTGSDEEEVSQGIEAFGEELNAAVRMYNKQQQLVDTIFSNDRHL